MPKKETVVAADFCRAPRGMSGSPLAFARRSGGLTCRPTLMGTRPISPGVVVARVWEIYRDQFPRLGVMILSSCSSAASMSTSARLR